MLSVGPRGRHTETAKLFLRDHVLAVGHLFPIRRISEQRVEPSYLGFALPFGQEGIDEVADLADIQVV